MDLKRISDEGSHFFAFCFLDFYFGVFVLFLMIVLKFFFHVLLWGSEEYDMSPMCCIGVSFIFRSLMSYVV